MAIVNIAGTGKTLLQSALALYFARLGFKVLLAPPSNSNANHSALELAITSQHEHISKYGDQPEVAQLIGRRTPISKHPGVCRIFASSLGKSAEKTAKGQAQHAQPFHQLRATSTLRSLIYTLKGRRDVNDARLEYDLEHKVIHEAAKGELKFTTKDRI